MGESFMNLFPADPLLPKPDWPHLRRQLLEREFIRESKLRYPDYSVVHHLWDRIVVDRGRPRQRAPDRLNGFDTLIEGLKNIELVTESLTLSYGSFTIPEFIATMQGHGCLSEGFTFPEQEGFSPGSLYWELSGMKEPSDAARWGTEIYFEDFGDTASVACGEGLFAPPGIPGTDRVCADWQELMNRWYLDQTQKWIDPETGKGYGILDLDWNNTLGAGRCWLEIHSPGCLDGNAAAALLTKVSGQEFRHSWYRL